MTTISPALNSAGVNDPVIQSSTNKPDEVLIKIPLDGSLRAKPRTRRAGTTRTGAGGPADGEDRLWIHLARKPRATRRWIPT